VVLERSILNIARATFLVAEAYRGRYIQQTTGFSRSRSGRPGESIEVTVDGRSLSCTPPAAGSNGYVGHDGLMVSARFLSAKRDEEKRRDHSCLRQQEFFADH
jgi:hypothetical protein